MSSNTPATVEEKVSKELEALYTLQTIDSEIDKIKAIRGQLPLEVQDLEDEIAGFDAKIEKLNTDIANIKANISGKEIEIQSHQEELKKYNKQLDSIKNNREYEAIQKEIEFQNISIQLCEKKIRTSEYELKNKKLDLDALKEAMGERAGDLEVLKAELDKIVEEHKEEEEKLQAKSLEIRDLVKKEANRWLNTYDRIRGNARNGIAVAQVERESCGGCFSQIPAQRQIDIKLHKNVIVCEYCGRILVDEEVVTKVNSEK